VAADRGQDLDVVSDVLHERRPDEHGVERSIEAGHVRSASNESTWRPKALRRTVMSMAS
jgi:hypothetical protein